MHVNKQVFYNKIANFLRSEQLRIKQYKLLFPKAYDANAVTISENVSKYEEQIKKAAEEIEKARDMLNWFDMRKVYLKDPFLLDLHHRLIGTKPHQVRIGNVFGFKIDEKE
jgi:hypothetical protein